MTLRDLLLGRERELAVLGRALAAAETGVPTLVLVEGDAGSGKSTLVDRFAEISSAHTLRRARGLEWESNTAFGVIEQLLERPVSNSDPVAVAHEIVDAAEQLTLIVVDDAHHSDVSSLQAITSALHRGRTAPLLFVLVAEETPFLREDVRQILDLHWSTRLHISPIDAPVIIDIARMRSGIDLSSGVALALQDFTAGNTLDIVSLLDELPPTYWTQWHRTLPVPRHRAVSIAAALATCSAGARTLIEAAAVVGRSTTLSHLAQLAEIDDVVGALDSAFASGLLSVHEQRGSTEVSLSSTMVTAAVRGALGPRTCICCTHAQPRSLGEKVNGFSTLPLPAPPMTRTSPPNSLRTHHYEHPTARGRKSPTPWSRQAVSPRPEPNTRTDCSAESTR
ncbi:hypothetical protein EN35_22640 [Rhodococcus qingshengii]|nr:hypothetical protein EN35_22640 [Rhodococcus qingshengii]